MFQSIIVTESKEEQSVFNKTEIKIFVSFFFSYFDKVKKIVLDTESRVEKNRNKQLRDTTIETVV